MQAGLRDILGENGVGALAMHLFREEQARAKEQEPKEAQLGAEVAPVYVSSPDWLSFWERRHQGRPWGFVVFRTALYGAGEEASWGEFKSRVEKIVQVPFERIASESAPPPEGFGDASAKFEIRWVEDPELAGATAAMLRGRYATMRPSLPNGSSHTSLFLCASAGAVESVMSIEEEDLPTGEMAWWRPTAPFLLAVSADADLGLEEGHEEREWFRPVFKVAVETMVEELWPLIGSDQMPLRRVTRNVKGSGELDGEGAESRDGLEEIWWTMASSPKRLRRRRGGVESGQD